MKHYLKMAKNLEVALSVKYPETLLTEDERTWRLRELCRQVVTVSLFQSSRQDPIHRDENLNGWIKKVGEEDAYSRMLTYIFTLPEGGYQTDSDISNCVTQVLKRFEALPTNNPGLLGHKSDIHQICADTWLALAYTRLPLTACFDTWRAMCQKLSGDPLAHVQNDQNDPLPTLVTYALTELYTEWQGGISGDEQWKEGLKGRINYVQEVNQYSIKGA